MEIILFIIILLVLFPLLGIGGWILSIISHIIGFLFDGCLHGIGCLILIIFIIFLIFSAI